ncbi:MAG: TatD family hydrolase [Leucothrix sp.]
MRLIDSHCHLDLAAFDIDRDIVMQRASENGISDVIIPAVQASGWGKLQALVGQDNPLCVHAAYGLHPVFDPFHSEHDLVLLEQQLGQSCVAVGECGLDFFIDDYDCTRQLAFFTAQLDLAVQFQLPVIIHSRKSLDLVLKELRLRPSLQGVVHSFSGSEQQAKQLIEQGFYLGFGGPITYPRANKLRRLVAELPLEWLLLETDAPDQPDITKRGQRNEPSWLPTVAACFAELRGCSIEEVAEVTSCNSECLFGLESG